MSTEITTAFVNEYEANIDLLLQQEGSLMDGAVRRESQSSEYDYFDRIGSTAAKKKTVRHGDTPLMNTPHDRRQVALEDYEWADLIDRQDRIRMLNQPDSAYALNAAYALGRSKDDEILTAVFGTAKAGKAGGTSVTFPSAQQVAVNYVEAGSAVNSGLTVGKLRRARTILRSGQVQKREKLYIAVTAQQMQDLLRTTEVTSIDFNGVRALVNGEITNFMGFEFVEIERLNVDGSSYRRVPVWAQSGLLLSSGEGDMGIMGRISERDDKSYATQVYASGSFGSTRMEEGKVVEILCDES